MKAILVVDCTMAPQIWWWYWWWWWWWGLGFWLTGMSLL